MAFWMELQLSGVMGILMKITQPYICGRVGHASNEFKFNDDEAVCTFDGEARMGDLIQNLNGIWIAYTWSTQVTKMCQEQNFGILVRITTGLRVKISDRGGGVRIFYGGGGI